MARTLPASTAEPVAQLNRVSWYARKREGQPPHPSLRRAPVGVEVDVPPAPWRAGRGERAHLEGAQPQQDGAEKVAGDGE